MGDNVVSLSLFVFFLLLLLTFTVFIILLLEQQSPINAAFTDILNVLVA